MGTDAACGCGGAERQAMEGEEEEEIAMVGTTMGDYRNLKCPLSGVDIHDLNDPVWDQEQIIYEREAIEVRPVPCFPVSVRLLRLEEPSPQ